MIADNDATEPAVCIEHVRWAEPCLGDRHDTPAPCRIVRDFDVSELIRDHHNGYISREEAREEIRSVVGSFGLDIETLAPQKVVW